VVGLPQALDRTLLQMPHISTPSLIAVPVTLAAWAAVPSRELDWPVPFPDIVPHMAGFYRRYLEATIGVDEADDRRILLLGRRPMQCLALIQFALMTEGARAAGQRLTGHEVLDYLADGASTLPPALQPIGQPIVGSRFMGLRRLARTRSWTPALRLPRAMFRPDGVALTHNALLRTYLRRAPDAVRNAYDIDFDEADGPIDDAFMQRVDVPALTEYMIGAVTTELPIGDDIQARLQNAVRSVLLDSYRDAAGLLGRLRATRRLPHRVYTGTGSKRMSRALGLEVIRRGGEATRCDHGGSLLLLHGPDYMALNELSVSSRFVVPTPTAAASPELLAGIRRVASLVTCSIDSADGDPGLDVGAAAFVRSSSDGGRRRAMYVPSVFYGLHQASPPVLAGPLYLDWQARLVSMLQDMPIDLLCKPHPGGHKPPAELNPMRNAQVISAPFEQAVADADVLIYDFPATTTLAVGLCSDRPIVLIDHGTMQFNPSLADEVAARCTVVRCTYNDRNLPVVSRSALESAICDSPVAADPTYFRRLFLGDA
jgi:hypothetical protein